MARLRSKIGVGSMAIGVALMVVGVFAGGASAQTQQSGDDDRLTCAPEQGFHFRWGLDSAGPTVDENGFVDVSGLAGRGETTVSNGDVTVTLSDAAFLVNGFEGWAGPDEYRIKSLKFELTQGAATAVIVRLWEDIGVYSFVKVPITGTSGEIASPEGSHEILGQAPIKGLEFCYEAEVIATSTTQAPTTTVEVAPTSVTAAPTTAAPATTIGVEVLPQVVTAPQAQAQPQLAFSGSESTPFVLLGGGLLVAGLLLVGVDKVGLVRRGEHSR